MPDEIVVKTESKPESESVASSADAQNCQQTLKHLINFCALGLGVSFFLPWVHVLFGTLSGFDLQKMDTNQLWLWLIPFGCVVTIIAGFAKQRQQIIGQLTGVLPFVVGIFWWIKIREDLFHILTYGAFLSLGFGLALLILCHKAK